MSGRRALLPAVMVAVALASCGRLGRRSAPPVAPAPVPVAGPDSAARPAPAPVAAAPAKPAPDSAKPAPPAARDSAAPRTPPRKARPTSRDCVLDFDESPPETRMVYSRVAEGQANTFIGGGFVGHCQGESNRLRADSAEQFQIAGVVNLFGNVQYEEPGKLRLTANHAVYLTREGRLVADGNVVATQLRSGSTLVGSSMEYYREVPGGAPSRLVAPGRPVARLVELDSAGQPTPPVTITANTLEQRGDTLAVAWGEVVITRESIAGYADSAAFDKATERARLIRGARIRNLDSAQAFTLTGDTIDLFSTNRRLTRVLALHKGTAISADVTLEAERIDVRLADQRPEEAFAFGDGRSRARTATQDLDADSLHIRLPGQRVREVRAVGAAAARGTPDTTQMVTEDPDLLRGDSIFAWFDSAAVPRDTARRGTAPRDSARATVREIRAIGSASSFFQMASKQGRATPPSITYSRGWRILVEFDSGAVRRVRVDSAASGLYLEPVTDSLADSSASGGGRREPGGAPGRRPPSGTPTPPSRRPPPPQPSLPLPSLSADFASPPFPRRSR